MPTTCATCHAEVGDAAACPRCGTVVLSPQADELDVSAHSDPQPPAYPTPSGPPVRWSDETGDPGDDDEGPRFSIAAVAAWVAVVLALALVAVGGVWLLFSPGDAEPSPQPPAETRTQPGASNSVGATDDVVAESPPSASDPAATDLDFSGEAVDLAATTVASAPRTAPPNADAFGNRTTYDAANLLDGRPDTCWRTPGDATGLQLRFQLAAPTQVTRVGLVNGYAKNAVVGGRNLNWYVGNRRVLSARWVFDDGFSVDQRLVETKQMQTIDLGDPVTTSTVTLVLRTVSLPGTGRSARDYTAVSEVALVGVPGT